MKRIFWFLSLLLLFTVFLTACTRQSGSPEIDCNIHAGYCSKTIDNISVVFDCNPKPVKSMSELLFSVTLKEKDKPIRDAHVEIDLTMPGMFMGDNKILLMHKENGRYEGKGVIVRCPSGKRIWEADVVVDRPLKNVIHASYVFEVKN
ncbi:hypothetical protein A45J_2154 [hot springs metagenome]|uniref:YtkA-like domain-containing protein n=1 Tax=hot springs metagenome TaxID=433727 RepID=A0A5J4L3Z0_9ZZZZ